MRRAGGTSHSDARQGASLAVSIPHTRDGVWPAVREGRFAKLIQTHSPASCRLALLGLPDDTGVGLNHGRKGAREGPAAFRQALGSFGASFDGRAGKPIETPIFDAGDVQPAVGEDERALLETHERVEAAVRELHRLGLVTFCIGGGHDLSLPSLRALSRAHGGALGGINLDAHLDVRARVGSGMPFRRLIEGGFLDPRHFVELGVGRFSNDQGDVEWLRGQGATLVYSEDILAQGLSLRRAFETALGPGTAFVSIDLDGLDQSAAPGVSAPNPCGLSVAHAAELAQAAGESPSVLHFDVMELNPSCDLGERTARAAALLCLQFVAGFRLRSS